MSWQVLANRIALRLPPTVVRFQGGEIRNRRVEIDAFHRDPVPDIPPFIVTVAGTKITVAVRTHRLPDDQLDFGTADVAFSGVHPGAAIVVDLDGSRERGGICALLGRSGANAPSHLITCGHVFPPGSQNTSVIAGDGSGTECEIGTLTVNLLDRTTNRLDVALVMLGDEGIAIAQAGGPGPKLQGVLDRNNLFNLAARAFKPTAGDYSESITDSKRINAHIKSTQWPGGFHVEGVIATLSSISDPGDSGTILATKKPVNAIGSCTSSDGAQSLFEPLERAISALRSKYQLVLWRNP